MTASSKPRVGSRFIPSEELGVVSEWRFGSVGQPALVLEQAPVAEPEVVVLSEQERLDLAWEDGYAAGLALGRTEATNEANQRLDAFVHGQGQETAEKMAELLTAMHGRLDEAEQGIAQQVLALACGLARQMVRRELALDPLAIKPVIHEALGMLVMDGKTAVIKLHPLDMEVVEAALREAFPSPTLTWLPDPTVERGGCLVESGGTVIDGTLSRRWERAVGKLGLESFWAEPGDAG